MESKDLLPKTKIQSASMNSSKSYSNKENTNNLNQNSGTSDSSGLDIHYSDTSSDQDIDISLYHVRNQARKERLLQEQEASLERIKELSRHSSPLRQKKVWFAVNEES